MTTPLTFLDAAILAQTAAKVAYEELQTAPPHKRLQRQLDVSTAYHQARVCYDMWDLHRQGVKPTVIRDWVRGWGWRC